MSTTVNKYPLPLEGCPVIHLPVGAIPLYVATQGDAPFLWCRVDPEMPSLPVRFRLAGTGHPLEVPGRPPVGLHIGSFQMHGGALVFHLFAPAPS